EDEEERKKSFYYLFVEQFAPPERQHRQVNLDKGLSDGFVVGMFLSSLKKNNTTFVAVAVPKDLNEAISVARRVEAGDYYRQHQLEARMSQQKLGNEL
ncbi:1203_t:CDS:2, partial [Gigaspora rosea]